MDPGSQPWPGSDLAVVANWKIKQQIDLYVSLFLLPFLSVVLPINKEIFWGGKLFTYVYEFLNYKEAILV